VEDIDSFMHYKNKNLCPPSNQTTDREHWKKKDFIYRFYHAVQYFMLGAII